MPAPPRWNFLLTDLQGTVLGELNNAKDRSVTLPLNRIPTASFSLPLWHDRADDILNGDTMVKAYRIDQFGTSKLVFFGPTLSVEESGDSLQQSIGVSATGPFWRLTKRLIGQSKFGFSLGMDVDAGGLKDLGTMAHLILETANGNEHTGIKTGYWEPSTNGGVGPWHLKNVAEAIAELSAGINSFDYEVEPLEPQSFGAWPIIGQMHVFNLLGQNRPDAIFEYGTSRANVSSYNRQLGRDSLLTRAIVSVQGWPDGAPVGTDLIVRQDDAARAARGLFEEVVNDAGVIDATLRTQLADENLKYRSHPRQILTFSPTINTRPYPFTDYNVGDFVRCRAVVRGSVRFDAMFRIWGVTFKLDQNGNESLDLQLVQDV